MDQQKLFIPIILGTARQGRYSEKVARFVLAEAKRYGLQTELVDVRQFAGQATVPPWAKDEKSEQWAAVVRRAAGLIVVMPEYNHGYPGELKLLFDRLEDEYADKAVAFCGVSSGTIGGARAIENFSPVVLDLRLRPVLPAVYFTRVKTLFDAEERITDSSYTPKLEKLFSAVLKKIQAL